VPAIKAIFAGRKEFMSSEVATSGKSFSLHDREVFFGLSSTVNSSSLYNLNSTSGPGISIHPFPL
jgi:hypothetical protein